MTVKHRTSVQRVSAALKLTGMAAAALSFVMMLALTGCPTDSGTDSEPPVKYTVTFDANGGTPATQTAEVETGKTAALPTPDNATAGQTFFQGWYTKKGTGNDWGSRFTEATPVTANITVYARWGAAALQQCTVTFDSQDGSAVPSVTVNSGDTLGTLPQPTKTGNTLSGWFRAENEGGTKFTGETPVTANITLYAKWTAAPSGGGKSKLTITDIPEELKDKYVFARALQGEFFGLAEKPAAGAASVKAVKITGTTVVIPLWTTADGQSWTAYEGNESYQVDLFIGETADAPANNWPDWGETLTSSSAITFANGGATEEASLFFGGGGDGVPYGELAAYLDTLEAKDAEYPNTVKIAAVNISTGGVMGAINNAVLAKKKFVTLDLSDCSATGDEISGTYNPNPNSDHMNVIKGNQYIVGIILPNSLTSISVSAFDSCSSLTSVTIPAGVDSIMFSAFWGCSNLRFTVADGSSYSTLEEGKMLIKRNGNNAEVITYPSASGAFTVPNSVTIIGYGAFADSSILTSVTIPSSVTTIQARAFDSCSSLASVTFQGTIGAGNFLEQNTYNPTFPGDLRAKYLATGGGAGTYTTTQPGYSAIWTKVQ